MDDDLAIPDFLRVDAAEQARRGELWRGRRLRPTSEMNFATPADRPAKDPGTERLLAEQRAKDLADKKAKRASDKEARIIKARQKANPTANTATTEGATTMTAKTTEKTTAPKKKKAQPKTGAKRQAKSATAKARTPVAAGERSRYDWKGAEEKALLGHIPPKPDFSAPTHARFLPIMEAITAASKPHTGTSDADDRARRVKILKAIEISPISSTPKAMARYRDLCVKALTGAR